MFFVYSQCLPSFEWPKCFLISMDCVEKKMYPIETKKNLLMNKSLEDFLYKYFTDLGPSLLSIESFDQAPVIPIDQGLPREFYRLRSRQGFSPGHFG
jgi:hypothetical protein